MDIGKVETDVHGWGLTCRRAPCRRLLPPCLLTPQYAWLPVIPMPSAQMHLLPFLSTLLVTASMWQAKECPLPDKMFTSRSPEPGHVTFHSKKGTSQM